jgi:succinate dehydrogenase hydrophobic anchor subunit
VKGWGQRVITIGIKFINGSLFILIKKTRNCEEDDVNDKKKIFMNLFFNVWLVVLQIHDIVGAKDL